HRLLEIVTEHGLQLVSLRQDHEALKQETKALRQALSDKAQLRPDKKEVKENDSGLKHGIAAQPSADAVLSRLSGSGASTSSRKSNSATYPARCVPTPAKSEGGNSVCSTSSGSEAGSMKRSSSSGSVSGARKAKAVAKPSARPKEACDRDKERQVRSSGRTSRPGSPLRAERRESSADERGERPRSRPTSARRSSSGSPAVRSVAQRPAASLYQAALPLLEPSSREKRALALGAVARCLKDGASARSWDGHGTPLRGAVQAQSAEMAKLLLEAKASPNEHDAKGVSVLHTASFDGLTDLCLTLLKARADANAADQHGQTALFFAPTGSVCDALLDHKASVNAVNQKGQSALHLASRAGLSEVLLWFAPRVSREVVELRDVHGATAAYYARHAGVNNEFLMKHKLTAADPPSTTERPRRSRREGEAQEDGARERSAWATKTHLPLPPLLEDQHSEEEEAFLVSSLSLKDAERVVNGPNDEEELPCSTVVAPLAEEEDKAEDAFLAPEVPVPNGSAAPDCEGVDSQPEVEHAEEVSGDAEMSGEEPSPVKSPSGAPHQAWAEEGAAHAEAKEAAEATEAAPVSPESATDHLDRADKMVTWEEDCGHPGSALLPSSADVQGRGVDSLADSVASDASDGQRRERRTSANQAFLWQLNTEPSVEPVDI
ncbi:unnamed protein product, partial [Effrenium voratum]